MSNNPANTGGPNPGGKSQHQGRNPGNPNPKPTQPKIEIKAFHSVTATSPTEYQLNVEVSVYENRLPLAGQEVILKEQINIVDQADLDAEGMAILRSKGKIENYEKNFSVRICLAGRPEEKTINVVVPAIKTKVYPPKDIAIHSTSVLDLKKGVCHISFECTVMEDSSKPCTNQNVELRKGTANLGQALTDNYGKVSFSTDVPLEDSERIHNFRFCLVGLKDEKDENITLPAKAAAKTKGVNPETMQLLRHGRKGKFSVLIRILQENALGVSTDFSVHYKGQKYNLKTDKKGENLFQVPGKIRPGEEEILQATVPGIEDMGKVTLKYRRRNVCRYKKYTLPWFFKTNNGRAALLIGVWSFLLVMSIIMGTGHGVLNERTFRHENGLSAQEDIFNRTVGNISPGKVIKPVESRDLPGNSSGPYWWRMLLILTPITFIYWALSWREEIEEVIAEHMEDILHRSETHVSDPAWERLSRMTGVFHAVKNKPATRVVFDSQPVVNVNPADPAAPVNPTVASPAPAAPAPAVRAPGNAFWQYFKAGLTADIAVELIEVLTRIITKKAAKRATK